MVVIDYQAFPHIFDAIVDAASAEALLKVRQTGKAVRQQVDERLYKHVVVYPRRIPRRNHNKEDDNSQSSTSSRPGFMVSTLATDEELGKSILLPPSGLWATDVVDWFGCDGQVPDLLRPEVVRRFAPNRVPMLHGEDTPRARTYVDYVCDQEAADHMYENVKTPRATDHVIHHSFDVALRPTFNVQPHEYSILRLTVVLCPEIGTSPWKPGPVVYVATHLDDLVCGPAYLWAMVLEDGGTVTIVGFERVMERMGESLNTTVSALHLRHHPNLVMEHARSAVQAELTCEPDEIDEHMERFNFMSYEEWAKTVPSHVSASPGRFPDAVEQLLKEEHPLGGPLNRLGYAPTPPPEEPQQFRLRLDR